MQQHIEEALPDGFYNDPTRGRAGDYKCPRCSRVPVFGNKTLESKLLLVLGCTHCKLRWIARPNKELCSVVRTGSDTQKSGYPGIK